MFHQAMARTGLTPKSLPWDGRLQSNEVKRLGCRIPSIVKSGRSMLLKAHASNDAGKGNAGQLGSSSVNAA